MTGALRWRVPVIPLTHGMSYHASYLALDPRTCFDYRSMLDFLLLSRLMQSAYAPPTMSRRVQERCPTNDTRSTFMLYFFYDALRKLRQRCFRKTPIRMHCDVR